MKNSKVKNEKSKIIGLLIGLFSYWVIGLLNSPVSAQSPTTTPIASPTARPMTVTPTPDKKISELKERIATRVAELNLVEKRGILGNIATISGTKITLVDIQKRQRVIDTDELTKFGEGIGKNKSLKDFTNGDAISAFGLYNKSSRVLLARDVREVVIYQRIFGEVTDIDEKNFVISVREQNKEEESLVSFEKTTLASQLLPDAKLVKSGFSKIAVGDKIFVVATPSGSVLRLIYVQSPKKTPTPTSAPAKTTITPTR